MSEFTYLKNFQRYKRKQLGTALTPPSRPPLPRSSLYSPPHTPPHPPTSPSPASPSSTLAPPSPASPSPPLLTSVEADVGRTPKRNRSV